MMSSQDSKKTDKWWKKPPRSSRICFRCGHKYSSHIDIRCLKIVSRKPRTECDCKGFVANKEEWDFMQSCRKGMTRTKNAFKRMMAFK